MIEKIKEYFTSLVEKEGNREVNDLFIGTSM
jgi:hypothetical protein